MPHKPSLEIAQLGTQKSSVAADVASMSSNALSIKIRDIIQTAVRRHMSPSFQLSTARDTRSLSS